MMNDIEKHCPEIREKLPLYIGGDLDPEVLESVSAHLASCEECALRAGEAFRARRLFVGTLQEADLRPPELWSDLRQVLSSEGRIHDPSQPVPLHSNTERRPRLRLVRYAGALAAAAAVLALASPLFRSGSSPGVVDSSPTMGLASTGAETTGAQPVAVHPTGGLQRVAPGAARPLGEAVPVHHQLTLPKAGPSRDNGQHLAGFR